MATKRKSSHLWNHFEEVTPNKQAKCCYCSRILAISQSSIGSLNRHLKAVHPMISYDIANNSNRKDRVSISEVWLSEEEVDKTRIKQPRIRIHDEDKPDLDDNSSNSDAFSEPNNQGHDYEDIPTTTKKPVTQTQKCRVVMKRKDPPKLQRASRNISHLIALNNTLSKQSAKEEDECDLFCKMLAKQIKAYPILEREEIMYELHGVMLRRRRQYNAMQGRPFKVSHPSRSNSISTPPHGHEVNEEGQEETIILEEIQAPGASKMCYESFGNMVDSKKLL